MPRYPLDDGTVESLLRGAVAPDDAPPELRRLAALVGVARRQAEGDELMGADRAAAGFAAVVARGAGSPDHPQRRTMLKKLTTARVLAIAAPVALLGAGTAAAASDSLPAPAQSAVASALAHLDVSVPNPDSHAHTPENSKAVGPDAGPTSPATFGLCQAVTSGGLKNHNSPPYRNLATAAGGPSGIASYCAGIIAAHNANSSTNPGTNSGTGDSGTGPSGGTGKRGGDSGTDNRNAPSNTPPVNVPPKGKPSGVPPSQP